MNWTSKVYVLENFDGDAPARQALEQGSCDSDDIELVNDRTTYSALLTAVCGRIFWISVTV
jgi:hypothetical protein